jgi:DNA-binding NtrC family response regulator
MRNETPHLLYVDDEQPLHSVLQRLFSRHNIRVTAVAHAREAMELMRRTGFDLVLTDFKMPDVDGLELLAHVRQEYPHVPVIMITAHASVQHAVGAMRGGAVDYIPKPFSTAALLERVRAHLDAAVAPSTPANGAAPARRNGRSEGAAKGEARAVTFVGSAPAVEALRALIARIAPSQAPVFVHGESGTGKEIVSRLLHAESDRAGGPFVAINCANLPRELVESHLFGHRKGAFTGAVEDMTGAFERAGGGTLLLDEITEIDLPVQAKLLRVLQEQEFYRVGSSEPQRCNVRVVATSNRNTQDAIRDGLFREDLYHRLAVFPLSVPALRERRSDIPALAAHFARKYATLYGLPPKRLSDELLARFEAYDWPGNVRQLENMVHRGVVLAGPAEVVEADDVMSALFADARPTHLRAVPHIHSIREAAAPVEMTAPERAPVPPPLRRVTIEEMEREMILHALSETNGNQEAAAARLGISARTIRNKLKRYRDDDDDNRAA